MVTTCLPKMFLDLFKYKLLSLADKHYSFYWILI